MKKNKIIALAIIVVLILLPFQWAFIDFSVETQLLQSLMMTVTVLGAVIAIYIFNKDTGESAH